MGKILWIYGLEDVNEDEIRNQKSLNAAIDDVFKTNDNNNVYDE